MERPRSVVVRVVGCARCGATHNAWRFRGFRTPCDGFTHWAMCPLTREPILLKIVSDTTSQPADPQQDAGVRKDAPSAGGGGEPLTFARLREANDERAKQWTHNGPPTPLSFAVLELCGEAGELANAVKKVERHAMGMAGGSPDLANAIEEVADVVICADLVARKLGIDLGDAVARKFNATSRKHGFTVSLPERAQ